MNSKVIIACDFNNENSLNHFLAYFGQEKLFLKLGSELIYSSGFNLINKLTSQGHKIFLDLKLHDITNTMVKTLQVLQQYQIDMLTIHLLAGVSSLQTLKEKLKPSSIKLIGVSILTNLDNNDIRTLLLNKRITVKELVLNLTKLASESKFYGVVCSAWESSIIKKHFPNLITVCPGIQLKNKSNDQKRVVSPKLARRLKADYIVVGREITNSINPYTSYHKIKRYFQGANDDKN